MEWWSFPAAWRRAWADAARRRGNEAGKACQARVGGARSHMYKCARPSKQQRVFATSEESQMDRILGAVALHTRPRSASRFDKHKQGESGLANIFEAVRRCDRGSQERKPDALFSFTTTTSRRYSATILGL